MAFSNLGLQLLRLFAKGDLAATQVQLLAKAAWDDGWGQNCQLARKLAHVGTSGKHSSNIFRDIITAAELVGLISSETKPYYVNLPGNAGTAEVFLPHEVYEKMVQRRGIDRFCLSPTELASATGLGALLTRWAGAADVQYEGDLGQVGVFGVHCDGVTYSTSVRAGSQKSVLAASFNVISATDAKDRDLRQPLFVIQKSRLCKCGCGGFHSLQVLYDVLAWSMRCLLQGRAPSRRHDDTPFSRRELSKRIAPGTALPVAALLQCRGDWEGLVVQCRLRFYRSDLFCWMCDCTQTTLGDLHYHHVQPDAGHRATLISHEQYLQSCADEGAQPSTIFGSPGFRLEFLAVDSMHAGDLGSFQDSMGSLFWVEITNRGLYRNKAEGLKALNAELQFYYDNHEDQSLSRLTPLSMSQIRGKEPGYPYLKSKAAECRHATDFCLMLAQRHRFGDANRRPLRFRAQSTLGGRENEYSENIVALFQGLSRYHRSCSAAVFDDHECKQAMYLYLQSHVALHKLFREDVPANQHRYMAFHTRPKLHALQHCVEDKVPLWGSPARFWCYRDEDYVGTIKNICRKTVHPATLEARCGEKLRVWSALESLGVH